MKTIAVIFGGRSTEHDVSIVTALASVIKPLELTHEYNVEPIYISRSGAWYSDQVFKDINMFSSGRIDDFLNKIKPINLSFINGLTIIKPKSGIGRSTEEKIDTVFPAMHGTYGEDGSLMGLLEMAGVPYVGCSIDASVLAMDKVLAKVVCEANDIPVTKYLTFSSLAVTYDSKAIVKEVEKHLTYPVFVKPPHLGSSIGISRANNATELENAIELAAHYDDKVLVEEAVHNLIEVTLPIIGNNTARVALLERPLTQAEDFFDFETKYMKGGKKGGAKQAGTKGAQGYSQLPADLPPALYAQAEATGIAVYKALGCSGTARVDMLIDSKTSKVFFNEVNPLPGDLYAHNWRAAGVSNIELVKALITYAEERFNERNKLTRAFTTNYLKQFK